MSNQYNYFYIDGYQISARYHKLFQQRKINSKELLLLSLIDTFTSCEDNTGNIPEGIALEYDQISDFLGISNFRTHQVISRLKRAHLIQETQEGEVWYFSLVEQHSVECGLWISDSAMQHFYNKKINLKEAALLSIIEEHAKNDSDCCLANAYFAKRLRLSEEAVSLCISKLKKLGLVKQSGFDGRTRYLTVTEKLGC